MKKRLLTLFLALALIFSLTGCWDDEEKPKEDDTPKITVEVLEWEVKPSSRTYNDLIFVVSITENTGTAYSHISAYIKFYDADDVVVYKYTVLEFGIAADEKRKSRESVYLEVELEVVRVAVTDVKGTKAK